MSAPFPIALSSVFGHWGQYAVFLIIGIGFGYVLEIAGFGNSKILAAQFYFKDMTVLKVMFTAIVVAMVLIFGASALGLLDFNLVWVNHTYLWPGIVGGLIMGVGFIIGGFCPGTSVVSTSTGKLDGLLFLSGVFFGIFVFGETVGLYEDFWYSSYLGRFTLMDWLGLPTGVVVLLVVLMALFMFWGSEQLERIFGGKDPKAAPKWRYGAAAALIGVPVFGLILGQPSPADRWAKIGPEKNAELAERTYQIDAGELLELMHDPGVRVKMLDVRSEADYNEFHIVDAEHVNLADLPSLSKDLNAEPTNTVFVVMSNGEAAATDAWKTLVSYSVPNVYILSNGVNGWIATFNEQEWVDTHAIASSNPDALAYRFDAALGARQPGAQPDPNEYDLEYTKKVQLQIKRGPLGSGCGG